MRNPVPFGEVRFGDADIEAPVEVSRIGIDDFAVEFRGKGYSESRLADGRRTGDDDDAWPWIWPLRRVFIRARLVVARFHATYYDDIGSAAIRQAGHWTVIVWRGSIACYVSSPNHSRW